MINADKDVLAAQKIADKTPTAVAQEKLAVAKAIAEPKYTIPHTVKLKHPVIIGSIEVEEIVFKSPIRARMVSHLPIGKVESFQFGHIFPILQHMTGSLSTIVDELVFEDLSELTGIVAYFLNNGHPTMKH